MESKKENYFPDRNKGLKTQTVNLRTSPDETELLRQAAEKLSLQTGQKENLSATIIQAVKQFTDQVPYSVNETAYKAICDQHTLVLRYYQAIASSYRVLGLGDLTMEVLQKILSNDLREIETRVYADIERNIERLGVKNEAIRANILQGTDIPYQEFKQSVQVNLDHLVRARAYDPQVELNVNTYSLENNQLVFSEADKLRVRESCSVYLDSPAKAEFVQVCDSVLKGFDELKIILARNGIKSIFGYARVFNVVRNDDGTEKIIYNKNILKSINK